MANEFYVCFPLVPSEGYLCLNEKEKYFIFYFIFLKYKFTQEKGF